MTKTIERFGYQLREGPAVQAHIVLRSYSKLDDSTIALTPAMTELEIDTNIQLLKEDLDRVGRLAKTAVQNAKTTRAAKGARA